MNTIWFKYLPSFIQAKLHNRPNLQAALNNSGWLLADKVLRMGVGLVVGVWIARYLGPEQFGLWNYTIAFCALFGAFATLGLDGIVVRELVKTPDRKNVLLGSAFALKFIGAAVVLILATLAISFIRDGEKLTLWLVGLSAIGFIFQSVNVVDFYFQAKVESKYTVYAANGAFVLMTLVKIVLLLISAPLIAFAWAGLGEVILTSVFLLIAYQANSHKIREWRYDRKVVGELLNDSWPLLLAGLAVTLYMKVDMVMLQQMAGDREVGIYAAATRLSEVWYFLPGIIVASVSPSIIKSRDVDKDLYISRLQRLYFIMAWLAIGISLPLSFLSGFIINLLYGPEFKEAAAVLAVHLWASAAVFLGVASSQYLLVEQLQRISFYRTLIGLICNIIINLILIPRMGALGAAIATVISYFIATFSLVLFKSTRIHSGYLIMAPFRPR